MKNSVTTLLSRSEVKFWLGIIAMVITVMVANGRIVTEMALMKKDIATIAEHSKTSNSRFIKIEEENEENTLAITVINTILKID